MNEPHQMKDQPLVTVMVITYNHARFIGEALDSILCQKTNFMFNIHVIEDCSTDGTQDILRDYERKYPDKIKLFLNKKNIGYKVTQKNFIRGFKTLDAKYIAILEGDDLWCNENKLQTQIDFLENHPGFVACAHNTIKFYTEHELPSERFLYTGPIKETHYFHEFIMLTSFFHLSTLVYRNVLKDRVPEKFENPYSCDIFITLAHAEHGKIHYDNFDWAKYRIHPGGRFSGIQLVKMWFFNIDGLRRYNAWFGYKYSDKFADAILKYCKHVLSEKNLGHCKLTFAQSAKLSWLIFIYSIIKFVFIPKNTIFVRNHFDVNSFNYKIIDNIYLGENHDH